MSRPTLREAIGRLVAEGVLEARRGSGTFVAPVDLGAIVDVRLRLEPFAAGLAARHRTPEQLAELRVAFDDMRSSTANAAVFADADARLHAVLARAAGNPVLYDILDRLGGLAKLSRAVTSVDAGVRAQTLAHMTALTAAVERQDSRSAERAMSQHLSAMREALVGRRRLL